MTKVFAAKLKEVAVRFSANGCRWTNENDLTIKAFFFATFYRLPRDLLLFCCSLIKVPVRLYRLHVIGYSNSVKPCSGFSTANRKYHSIGEFVSKFKKSRSRSCPNLFTISVISYYRVIDLSSMFIFITKTQIVKMM